MTRGDFEKAIDAFSAQVPFRPFTVEMVDGSRFEVDQARAIATRDGAAVYVKPGGGFVWFDSNNVTEILGDIAGRKAS